MYTFSYHDTATTEIYTLSLHDALPILESQVLGELSCKLLVVRGEPADDNPVRVVSRCDDIGHSISRGLRSEKSESSVGDRKSTRLNSSHSSISYAVFCLKKKTRSLMFV